MAEDPIRKEMDALKADIAQLRVDIAGLTSAVHDVASDKVKKARGDAQDRMRDTWEDLEEKLEEVIQNGKATVGNIEGQISQHPTGSLLTAFGIGFLVAKMLEMGGRR